MKKIKKYVDRFIATVKVNDKYDMGSSEWRTLSEKAMEGGAVDAVRLSFRYGYAKGYRAAMAEQKQRKERAGA